MKFKVTKSYNGDVELIYSNKTIMLTDKNKSILLTEEEYNSIPKHKQYLFLNDFLFVEFIEEKIKEEVKSKDIKKNK